MNKSVKMAEKKDPVNKNKTSDVTTPKWRQSMGMRPFSQGASSSRGSHTQEMKNAKVDKNLKETTKMKATGSSATMAISNRSSVPVHQTKGTQMKTQMKSSQEVFISADVDKAVESLLAPLAGLMGPPRRQSLPATPPSKGFQMKRRLRRMSEKFLPSFKEGPESEEEVACEQERVSTLTRVSDGDESDSTLQVSLTKPKVENGRVRISDQSQANITVDEQVTHLIYGEGYTGFENSEGLPDELLLVLTKTPDLHTLELQGYWNYTKIPTHFIEFLTHFPKLHYLRKLVLPKDGQFLDRMGCIMVGLFGLQLKSLECPMELLTGCCPKHLSQLVPTLKNLKIFAINLDVLNALLETFWYLEVLELGELREDRPEFSRGIPINMLEKVIARFGPELFKFTYLFPVTNENEELVDKADVQSMINKFMPMANRLQNQSVNNHRSASEYSCVKYRCPLLL